MVEVIPCILFLLTMVHFSGRTWRDIACPAEVQQVSDIPAIKSASKKMAASGSLLMLFNMPLRGSRFTVSHQQQNRCCLCPHPVMPAIVHCPVTPLTIPSEDDELCLVV